MITGTKRGALFLLAVAIAAIAFGWYWRAVLSQQPSRNGEEENDSQTGTSIEIDNDSHGSRRSHGAKVTLEEKVLNAANDPTALVKLASKLPKNPDVAVLNVYRVQLKSFSPKQLAELIDAHFATEEIVVSYVKSRETPDLLQAVFAALPKNSENRGHLATEAGEHMAYFTPKNIAEALKMIPSDCLDDFGSGLASRVKLMTSEADRMRTIEAYLSATDSPPLRNRLQAMWIEKKALDDPAATAVWLLQQKPEYISLSDSVVIKALVSKSPETAAEFVNTLLERNEGKRATYAVASMVTALAPSDPVGVLRWVEGLPRELPEYQTVVSRSFRFVASRHPEMVDEIISSTTDPILLDTYTAIAKSKREERNRGSSNKN